MKNYGNLKKKDSSLILYTYTTLVWLNIISMIYFYNSDFRITVFNLVDSTEHTKKNISIKWFSISPDDMESMIAKLAGPLKNICTLPSSSLSLSHRVWLQLYLPTSLKRKLQSSNKMTWQNLFLTSSIKS